MSLSPRVRCVALAIAALFASPASLYAEWLTGGGLFRGIVSSPLATAVAVLVATSFLRHAWDAAERAFPRV
jgi:hypothetical protein